MTQRGKHQRALLASIFVLALGLSATLAITIYVQQSLSHRSQTKFIATTDAMTAYMNQQLSRYVDMLYAARGYFLASQDTSREAWKQYVSSLSLDTNFPGLQGIGYAQKILPENLDTHESATRRLRGQYDVMPGGERPIYFPIVLLEPETDRNLRAIGFDMFTEPHRHEAMQEACDSGKPVATKVVTLVQETAQDVQPGFLIYLPHYRPYAKLDTVEERRANLLGFVYSPFRIHNLVQGILANQASPGMPHLHIFEGPTADPAKLIFETVKDAEHPTDILFRDVPFQVAGQTWLLRFYQLKNEENGQVQPPIIILCTGIIISFLLFSITFTQYQSRKRLAESEAALRVSELRFRLKIEQSPVAIQLFDTEGRSVYVNPAWEELWGISAAEVSDYNILADEQLQLSGQLMDVKRAFSGESVIIGPTQLALSISGAEPGYKRWVRAVLYPTRQASGQVREVVMMFEDFTKRKEAEEELRRQKERAEEARHIAEEASRAKDQFLAVLSHELRNPLSPVLTMVNALQSKPMSREETEDALKIIQRNVELEARLIDDLLDITRISRGKMHLDTEIINAQDVLRDALHVCDTEISKNGMKVNLDLQAMQTRVIADPARLEQVFWNLIKNAVKFTPRGGTITIRTRNEIGTLPALLPEDPQQTVLVAEVSDTGIGVEPDKLARIFDAFEQADRSITRRFGGLGLGLAISRALIQAHGGELTAYSAGRQKGATFTIRLPVTTKLATPRRQEPAEPGIESQGAALNILLVEDQDDARRGLTMILKKSGHHVRAAASVAEAMALATDFPFDVLISDIGLPDGDGYDICQRLKSTRHFYAIALTGLGMEEDIARARTAGFDEHLTKPVQFARLESLIARVESKVKA